MGDAVGCLLKCAPELIIGITLYSGSRMCYVISTVLGTLYYTPVIWSRKGSNQSYD